VEFLIDGAGRSRKVGDRNAAAAISKAGHVHISAIDRPAPESVFDRTVVVTLQPRLLCELTIAGLGNKLAALRPDRIVIVADLQRPECWVFSNCLVALRKVTALARGDGHTVATRAGICPM
jgi:hypothetical protein